MRTLAIICLGYRSEAVSNLSQKTMGNNASKASIWSAPAERSGDGALDPPAQSDLKQSQAMSPPINQLGHSTPNLSFHRQSQSRTPDRPAIPSDDKSQIGK